MFGTLKIVAIASMVFMCSFSSRSQVPFESEIREFERVDAREGYFSASVLFVGSSSIRMWGTLAADMSPLPVLNRGFGGASLSHVTSYADRIILPHKPRMIVLYAGENDLVYETGTIGNLINYFNAWSNYLKSKLPGTQLYFISIKPSIARWQYWEKMKEANRQIREIIDREPDYHYIDVASAMLTSSGYVREDIFLSDNLHMNAKGYAIWTSIIKPKLTEEYARIFGTQNRPPLDLALSNRRISENETAGAEIGTFSTTDPDAGDAHRYALVSGSGDAGNSQFTLESGGRLHAAVPFNFEEQNSYSIRVRTTDKAGAWSEQTFAIEVVDINEPPWIADLVILPHRPKDNEELHLQYIFSDPDAGNVEKGTEIRWFRSDTEVPDLFGERVVPPSRIGEGELWRVQVKPGDGAIFGQEVMSAAVEIITSNLPPSDIELSKSRISENKPAGTRVGVLKAVDPNEGDFHVFSLVAGPGDEDNSRFRIENGKELVSAIKYDYEVQSSYSVRLAAADRKGERIEKAFVIGIDDADDPPVAAQSQVKLSFDEDDPPAYIDLSALFYDQDGDSIAISIGGNNNPGLLTPAMDSTTLVLSLLPDAFGDARLSLKAVAKGKSAKSTVMVRVTPVDDPPRPVADIPRLIIQEDAPPVDVDLGGWFADVDGGDDTIVYRMAGVSDQDLLLATLQANTLTVAPVQRHWGEGFILLEAWSGSLSTSFELPVRVDRITGLPETGSAPVSLYPNPSNGEVWLDVEQDFSEAMLVTIYNHAGSRVFSFEVPRQHAGRIPLELSFLQDGAYAVVVDGQGISSNLRLLIRK